MPIYEYKCLDCDARIEKMQKPSETPLQKCAKCGGKLEKQWSLSGFQFKGAGWYVTDYSRKESEAKAAKAAKGDVEKLEKTDSAPAKEEKKSADKSTVTATETSNKAATNTNSKGDKN